MKTIQVSDRAFTKIREWMLPVEDDETQAVLRMAAAAEESVRARKKERERADRSPRDLVSQGGRVPHGTILRASYKGREYEAEVRDGSVEWQGDSYKSLSAAAVAVIQSTGSRRSTENGWRFWEYRDGNGRWRSCKQLQR